MREAILPNRMKGILRPDREMPFTLENSFKRLPFCAGTQAAGCMHRREIHTYDFAGGENMRSDKGKPVYFVIDPNAKEDTRKILKNLIVEKLLQYIETEHPQ